MAIRVKCASCGKVLTVKDEFAGKKGKCPACGAILRIPASSGPKARHEKETEASDSDVASADEISVDQKALELFANKLALAADEHALFLQKSSTLVSEDSGLSGLLRPRLYLFLTTSRLLVVARGKKGALFQDGGTWSDVKLVEVSPGTLTHTVDVVLGGDKERLYKLKFAAAMGDALQRVVDYVQEAKGGFERTTSVQTTGQEQERDAEEKAERKRIIRDARREGRLFNVKFVSGPFGIKPGSEVNLVLQDDRMSLLKAALAGLMDSSEFAIPYRLIKAANVETAERIGMLRTAAGYALFGVLGAGLAAFGFKKKDKFLHVEFVDKGMDSSLVLGKGTLGTSMEAIRGELLATRREHLASMPEEEAQTPAAVTEAEDRGRGGDIVEQVEKLAALRDKGLITDEEFEAKKKELLSRI